MKSPSENSKGQFEGVEDNSEDRTQARKELAKKTTGTMWFLPASRPHKRDGCQRSSQKVHWYFCACKAAFETINEIEQTSSSIDKSKPTTNKLLTKTPHDVHATTPHTVLRIVIYEARIRAGAQALNNTAQQGLYEADEEGNKDSAKQKHANIQLEVVAETAGENAENKPNNANNVNEITDGEEEGALGLK